MPRLRDSLRRPLLSVAVTAFTMSVPISANAATARAGNVVMGTVLQVTVVHDDSERARALAWDSLKIAKHWDDVLTTWRRGGELARLNARAGQGPVTISDDLHNALATMVRLSAETGGAFDPAVGPLVERLREVSPSGETTKEPSDPPKDALHIATALTLTVGHAELVEGAQLDSGGIGKGLALDAIAATLARSEAVAWYLDFGGSSQLGHGHGENMPSWLVGVAGLEIGSLRGTLKLTAGALSTSRALPAGDEAGAIIDPRTGLAIIPPVLATVHAPNATHAEVWSTALVVMGPSGIEKAQRAGVTAIVETATNSVQSDGFPMVSGSGEKSPTPTPDAK